MSGFDPRFEVVDIKINGVDAFGEVSAVKPAGKLVTT